MDCAEVRDAFARGQTPAGPDVNAHVRTCPSCAELFAQGGALGQGLAAAAAELDDPARLLRLVRADLQKETGIIARLRERSTRERVSLASLLALVTFAVTFGVYGRHDWSGHSPLRTGVTLGLLVTVAFACTARALRPLFLAPKPRATLLVGVLGLVLPWVLALWPNGALVVHGAPHFAAGAFACFAFGAALSLPSLLVLGLLRREGRPAGAWFLLAAAGTGLVANTVLELHCALNDPGHLLLGHASVGLAWLLAFMLPRTLASKRAV